MNTKEKERLEDSVEREKVKKYLFSPWSYSQKLPLKIMQNAKHEILQVNFFNAFYINPRLTAI